MHALGNVLNSVRKLARDLRACERGNVMVTFALATTLALIALAIIARGGAKTPASALPEAGAAE